MKKLEHQNRDQQKQISPEHSQADSDHARGLQMGRSVSLVDPSDGVYGASENRYDHGSSGLVISEDLETAR
jgi:hypothetical protein